MSYLVKICDNLNNINPIFVRANGFLIEKYEKCFTNNSTYTNKIILQELWLSEFNAKLITVDNNWKDIEFVSENDKMMFLLRWG